MNKEEQGKKIGQIISKAWTDDAFRQKLLSDGAAVLKEEGLELPEGVDLRVVENTENVLYLVLPPKPEAAAILSDDQLDDIAGGSQCRYMLIDPGHAIM